MNIRSINAINFKRLYISDDNYNQYQTDAVKDIKEKLTPEDRNKLGNMGYDVYVNNNTYFNYEVKVYVAKREKPNAIRVGSYCKNFDVKDVYRVIDNKESQDKKRKIIGWTAIGAAWLAVLAYIFAGGCSKKVADTQTSAIQKAKTELAQVIKK